MADRNTVSRALRIGTSTAALLVALTAAPAFAQDTTTQPSADVTQADQTAQSGSSQDIIVTGTLFRRTDTETPSPVTVLTNENLQQQGVTTIADAIRSISADSAGSIPTGFQGGFSAGGSAVSLRGLGVSSTLVLIDGLRSTNFPLNDDGHNAYVDLNSVPFSIVDRVEVLKDGASSTYGADAIGGVVNVILKKHFTGVAGGVEGGVAEGGYAQRYRANLTAGVGDYDKTGWNFFLNGEYQRDGRASVQDVGFPFNTNDLSSIGLADQNSADSSLTAGTPNAIVVRTTQTDLNNPFAAASSPIPSGTYLDANGDPHNYYNYTLLSATCPYGTFTSTTGANRGTGCAHDIQREYNQVQPKQERFSFTGRLSIRLNDNIEAYATGSYAHSEVDIKGTPPNIRQRQPYGAAPSTASNNPGVVLPVYICASGVDCATAPDRQLNPNNPYAAAFANDPANGAARIYYLFGDIQNASHRSNEVIRGTAGLVGHFGDGWDWRVEAVGARDNLKYEAFGVINIAGLKQAINTGAYNFVDPSRNTQAVRDMIAPKIDARGYTSLASLDASITKSVVQLPGGPLQIAVGGQVRRETLNYPGLNPDLENYANTAAAFGKHTVSAAYFEINAPVFDQLEIDASGRYDHYSEGFSHFSPKIGAKFTPFRQLAIRGTYSRGFRAPTFAESNPRSSFPGFVTYQPPCSFVLAHGGTTTADGGCSATMANGQVNPYAQSYSIGGGFSGNPNLKPETSQSFTAGVVFEPTRWLSLTADFYHVKKDNTIVAGPLAGTARANYYAGKPLPDGYSVGAVDAVDPLFPNALPRVLVINGPYVNSGYFKTDGLEFSANVSLPISDTVHFTSRLDVSEILKFNVDFGDGVVRKYVGTIGPYELSSGAGTPRWRGNWQNTLEVGPLSLTATVYYVSHLKQVAADDLSPDSSGHIDLSCDSAGDFYPYPSADAQSKYCYIRRFIYADLNASVKVNDKFTFSFIVDNFTNARAPIAPTAYSGTNYLPTWHYAGVIGRVFRAGATFKF